MKYALVNDDKTEATKGAKGLCRYCGSELIAKCGEIKINHWAHTGKRHCDPWWENETEWHRSWKDKFPKDWQEVRHEAEDGEIHIADVKTENGWIIEFQHSFLKPEERQKRNAFYRKIVWVVDGLRRSTDVKQFNKMLDESIPVCKTPLLIQQVRFPENNRLLREWHDKWAFVFIDFQEVQAPRQVPLWFLFPKIDNSGTYIGEFDRTDFIKLHSNNKFSELVKNLIEPIHKTLIENEQKIRVAKNNAHINRSSRFVNQTTRLEKSRRSKQWTNKRGGRGRF